MGCMIQVSLISTAHTQSCRQFAQLEDHRYTKAHVMLQVGYMSLFVSYPATKPLEHLLQGCLYLIGKVRIVDVDIL